MNGPLANAGVIIERRKEWMQFPALTKINKNRDAWVRFLYDYRFIIALGSRPEAASDAISGVVVDPTGMDVRVKLGDSKSNRSRDIRLLHFLTDERTTTNDASRRSLW